MISLVLALLLTGAILWSVQWLLIDGLDLWRALPSFMRGILVWGVIATIVVCGAALLAAWIVESVGSIL